MAQSTRFSSCIASLEAGSVSRVVAALVLIGSDQPTIVGAIDVNAIGSLEPTLLVMDVDRLDSDPLEAIRMARFVLRYGIVAVFTSRVERAWSLACHLAGAHCTLAERSTDDELAVGLLHALRSGCFTDPSFEAA